MKLSDIKPNPSNPRVLRDEKFEKLCRSITEFPKMMSLRPMVVDDEGVVLGGNMRLRALQHLGFKEVPDEWVKCTTDLTEEEKQRFIIADNVGLGEWDHDALANEWDSNKLTEWGLDLPKWDDLEQQDISEVEEFSEECNFTIKCKDVAELEELQTKLNCSGKKLGYSDFLIKAGL